MSFYEISKSLLGSFCILLSILRQTIAFWSIKEMYESRIVHKFPWMILVISLCSSVSWLAYWAFIDNIYFKITAIYGIIVNITFLLLFISFHDHLKSYDKNFRYLLTLSFFSSLYFTLVYSGIDVTTIGLVATFFNCLIYFSPLQKITECIEQKDNSYLPIRIITLNFINAIAYIVFIIIYCYDFMVLFPQLLAFMLSCIQIYFWFRYKKENQLQEEIVSIKLTFESLSSRDFTTFYQKGHRNRKAYLLEKFQQDEIDFKRNKSVDLEQEKYALTCNNSMLSLM